MSKILSFLIVVLLSINNCFGFIGNSTNGTSTDIIGSYINSARFLASSNMEVSHVYAKIGGTSGKYKVAIYNGSFSMPSNFIVGSDEVVAVTNGWYKFTLTSRTSLTNAQNYWLSIWSDTATSFSYYTDGGNLRWTQLLTYGDWPEFLSTIGGANYNYCIYADLIIETPPEEPPTEPPVVINTNSFSLRLAWDASPDASVTGYKVYYGLASGNYDWRVDAGNNLTTIVTNLVKGIVYYFAATAYDAEGVESDFSNEISYIFSNPTNPPPQTNAFPTISFIPNQIIRMNYSSTRIPVTIADPDSPITNLSLSYVYSNNLLFNNGSFVFTGLGTANLGLYLTPIANQVGDSLITLKVTDNYSNQASSMFLVTVTNPPNLVYIKQKLQYGLSIKTLTTEYLLVKIFTNPPANQIYKQQLLISAVPGFTNQTRVGVRLHYGIKISLMTIEEVYTKIFTNPPANQIYRSSLIITNGPF